MNTDPKHWFLPVLQCLTALIKETKIFLKKELCLKLDEKYFFSFSLLGGAGAGNVLDPYGIH